MPGLKVTDFGSTDGEYDAQYFDMSHSLRQFGIEARAALLDESKVEARGVRDCLKEVHMVHIGVGPGNGGVLVDRQRGDGWTELVTEVRVFVTAAVASPPGGIDCELCQVCKPTEGFVGSGRLTAG